VFDAPSIFLLIFAVSFVLTVLSFVFGVADLSIGGDASVDTGQGIDLGSDGPDVATDSSGGTGGISPFNLATILAFLTWFGGAGYLLTAHLGVGTVLALVLAAGVGLIGATIVFTFMARVLLPGQTPYLSDDDYEMAGTIGRLTVGIHAGGTGELVYSKGGTRRVISARTEDGQPLERGTEVVVVRQEGSVAYVEPFETFVRGTAPEGARR
jgi:membrane protein implicated in regulation of membrane protease activity